MLQMLFIAFKSDLRLQNGGQRKWNTWMQKLKQIDLFYRFEWLPIIYYSIKN